MSEDIDFYGPAWSREADDIDLASLATKLRRRVIAMETFDARKTLDLIAATTEIQTLCLDAAIVAQRILRAAIADVMANQDDGK